ncbi:MAG: ABC transporter ATP-binding protein [Rhodobacteraceae bacterium]|nr:ABC transporter ATP-binding protein [Paracoccaceae bacterium]
MTVLSIKNVSKRFGGVLAVDDLDLTVDKGEIVGLIGPNGSGKSTTINLICGVFPMDKGSIKLFDNDLKGLARYEISHLGIARTYQNIRLFGGLTVWQNVWIATRQNGIGSFAKKLGALFLRSQKSVEAVDELLDLFALQNKANIAAENLSFGEQRRLELARALASEPKLLLLDEPAAGMNSEEVQELRDRIFKVRDLGISVLLVEHVMELVMNVTDRINVLNFGKKIAEGKPNAIQGNALVQEAYFGS